MDKFPDQSQINRFLNRFDEANINQLEFIHHNLIILMKNTAFGTFDFGNIGIGALVKKLGTITARIIESEDHIEIVLPSLSKLSKLFVETLRSKHVQLSFYDILNIT